jgi:glycosyltransferase involved in cell wall biosynthesis
MKKILVVHNKYQNRGGEDIAVDSELDLLKKYFNVETLIFENTIAYPFQQFFYFLINRNIKSKKIIRKKIDNFQPDVIYIHNTWFKASLSVIKEALKSDAQLILKIHNFRYYCTKSFFSKKHFNNLEICNACGLNKNSMGIFNKYFQESKFKSLLISMYGVAYFKLLKYEKIKIAVLTEFHKNFMINLGIPKEKIKIVPNFISRFETNLSNEKKNYLVYAGRISKEKGVEKIIESFNTLMNKDYVLKIIGEGPQKQELMDKYESDNVNFINFIDNKDILKIISSSKGVITATTLYEGQPTLLCEASLLGVPSVLPKSGGILEFFPKNYELSFDQFDYLELRNLIQKLMDNNYDYLGTKNKEFIEKYLDEDSLINIFNELIEIPYE